MSLSGVGIVAAEVDGSLVVVAVLAFFVLDLGAAPFALERWDESQLKVQSLFQRLQFEHETQPFSLASFLFSCVTSQRLSVQTLGSRYRQPTGASQRRLPLRQGSQL